jgi:uncharacterized protein (UPF0332 family)
MIEQDYPFLHKAVEEVAGAELEFDNGWYNNCANRSYYACFHAAIAALQRAGIRPRQDAWSHDFVPAQFDCVLIYRRHLYPTELRGTLAQTYALRAKADYSEDLVTQTEANRLLRRTRTFVQTIQTRGGEPQ